MSHRSFQPNDVVEAPDGGLWRVLDQAGARVRCETADREPAGGEFGTEIVAWDADTLTLSAESAMARIMKLPRKERPT